MIETVAAIELAVDEKLIIKKNRLMPEVSNCNLKRICIVTGLHGDELEGQYVCYEVNRIINENKKEYTSTFAYIENVILMFPIIKYMNNVSHSLVFSGLEKPKKAAQTENLFLILKEIIYQFPNYDKLKESIKEDRLVQESLSMIFKRDFELYGTMHVESRDLLYDYLLYEN